MEEEAQHWLAEAQADLRRAQWVQDQEDHAFACFCAHQATEKAMKALVMSTTEQEPPETHDLTLIYRQSRDIAWPVEAGNLTDLSQYYVTSRYPTAGLRQPSISFTSFQANRAVGIARSVVEYVGSLLSTEADVT